MGAGCWQGWLCVNSGGPTLIAHVATRAQPSRLETSINKGEDLETQRTGLNKMMSLGAGLPEASLFCFDFFSFSTAGFLCTAFFFSLALPFLTAKSSSLPSLSSKLESFSESSPKTDNYIFCLCPKNGDFCCFICNGFTVTRHTRMLLPLKKIHIPTHSHQPFIKPTSFSFIVLYFLQFQASNPSACTPLL